MNKVVESNPVVDDVISDLMTFYTFISARGVIERCIMYLLYGCLVFFFQEICPLDSLLYWWK